MDVEISEGTCLWFCDCVVISLYKISSMFSIIEDIEF